MARRVLAEGQGRLVRRLAPSRTRSYAAPSPQRTLARLVLVPAIALSVALPLAAGTPSLALAAETAGLEQASPEQGGLVLGEDIFSTSASDGFASVPAETPAPATESAPTIDAPQEEATPTPVCDPIASTGLTDAATAQDPSYSESYHTDSIGYHPDSVTTTPQGQASTAQGLPQKIDALDNDLATSGSQGVVLAGLGITGGLDTTASANGGATLYESHVAQIIFSAGEGGSVTAGDASAHAANTQLTATTTLDAEPPARARARTIAPQALTTEAAQVTEVYEDSLSGSSQGASAVADEGYHFLWWADESTGEVLSLEAFFAPERPEGGWPAAWHIVAVFEQDTYLLILDPNGGSLTLSAGESGGGGAGPGPVSLTVRPGSDYQLPADGTDILLKRYNSVFLGWNTVADPSSEGTFVSYDIADGQALSADVEAALTRLGILELAWTAGRTPTLTLYAQWGVGQVTISYTAGEGGTILASDGVIASSPTQAREIVDVKTGANGSAATAAPQGVQAEAAARHHFAGWETTGADLTASDAASAILSPEAVSSSARYADVAGMPSTYHATSFEATFAPNSYVIAYAAGGGSGAVASTRVTYGSYATLATAGLSREGYTLSGWSASGASGATQLALGATLNAASIDSLITSGALADVDGATLTLTAQWAPDGSQDVDPSDNKGDSGDGDDSGEGGTDAPAGDQGKGDQGGEGKDGGSGSTTPTMPSTPATPTTPVEIPSASQNAQEAPAAADTDTDTTPARSSDEAGLSVPQTLLNLVDNLTDAVISTTDAATDAVSGLAASITGEDRDLTALDPVQIAGTAGGAAGATTGGEAGGVAGFFAEMTPAEAVEATGTAVAAVAAVGALAGLVGIGASIAGATAAGAAAIGTATTIGLTSAADLAADLAAESAATGGAGAGRRRREEDDDDEEEVA